MKTRRDNAEMRMLPADARATASFRHACTYVWLGREHGFAITPKHQRPKEPSLT